MWVKIILELGISRYDEEDKRAWDEATRATFPETCTRLHSPDMAPSLHTILPLYYTSLGVPPPYPPATCRKPRRLLLRLSRLGAISRHDKVISDIRALKPFRFRRVYTLYCGSECLLAKRAAIRNEMGKKSWTKMSVCLLSWFLWRVLVLN